MNITRSSKRKTKISDVLLKMVVYFASFSSLFVMGSVIFYIFFNGLKKINWEFLASAYSEGSGPKGILPMIINTIYVVLITTFISFPLGLGVSVYTTQYLKNKIFKDTISFSLDILSGIPSIIFGIFGYSIFCVKCGLNTSIIAGCLTMSICILPTIIRTSEEALRKVPNEYKEAAFALGTKNLRVLFTIVLRTALPEILSSIALYVGKILGESAIFIYTLGMSYRLPKGIISHIFSSGRTLTLHIYQTAKQANTSDSIELTFASSCVLIVLILLINLSFDFLFKRLRKN